MPSPKDPTVVVQPGPGNLPDGTVSASALNFNPSAGADAALAAHITNPTGAHADSAIATDSFGGLMHWSTPAGSVESTFETVFNGINARGMIVLDANPSATDADYVGPGALSAAYSFFAANNKTVFYLRPGVYTWSDSFVLSGVTIIGGGSPDTNFSTTQVEIQNLGGNIQFANGAILKNVILTASGNVLLPAGNGGCLFDNVAFKVTGFVIAQSSKNVFRQCGTYLPGGVPTTWSESGGNNAYDTLQVEQMTVSATGGCSFTNLTIGSGIAPAFPGSAQLSVTTANNSFNKVSFVYTGAVTAVPCHISSGINNTLSAVTLQGSNTNTSAVLVDSGATGCSITGLRLASVTCGTHMIRVLGSSNSLRGVSVINSSVTSSSSVIEMNGLCSVDSVNLSSLSGPIVNLVTLNGGRNNLSGLYTLVSATSSWINFSSNCTDSEVTGVFAQSTPSTATVAIVNIQGIGNRFSGLELNIVSTMAVPVVRFSSASSCSADKIRLTSISATAGAGFNLVSFLSSINCTAGQINVDVSANLGTTTPLVLFNGATGCAFDGLRLNNVATTTAINAPIVAGTGSLSSLCTVKNITSSLSSYAASTVLLSVDQSMFAGLVIEQCNIQEQFTGGTVIRLFQSGSAAQSTAAPIYVRDCLFGNANTSSGHTVLADTDFGAKAVFERCSLSASGSGMAVVRANGSWDVTFRDCNISAGGAGTIAASSQYAGTLFERCTFRGPSGGNSGTQLFNGVGYSESAVFPNAPLVIKDCTMIVGSRNVATAASTTPTVFLGGEGNSPSGALGPMVVDGLVITCVAALSPGWHPGPTLAVAVNTDLVSNAQSSFSNITIDMQRSGWNVAGTNCSVFNEFNTNGAVVEILGSDPSSASFVFVKPRFTNLAIRGLSRDGQGPRHVIKASGCSITGFSVDGVSFGTETSYAAETMMLKYVDLSESQLFTASSVLIGAFPFVKANTCNIRNVTVNNLNQGVVTDGSYLFDLTTSTLRECRLFVNAARLDYVIRVPNSTSYVENNRILMTGGIPLTNSIIDVQAQGNVISGNVISLSSVSVGIDLIGAGNVAKDNRFTYVISTSTVAAIRASGNYCRILSNHIEKSSALSTGLAQIHVNGGQYCQVSDNVIITEFNTVSTQASGINSSGYFCKITDNTLRNTNTAGSMGITSTADYTNVSGNRIWCTHNSFANAAFINATGNNQTLVVNHVENNVGPSGVITTGGTPLPSPVASFNQLT